MTFAAPFDDEPLVSRFLSVAAGGSLGAVARYAVSLLRRAILDA